MFRKTVLYMWQKYTPGILVFVGLLFTFSSCRKPVDPKNKTDLKIDSLMTLAADSVELNPEYSKNVIRKVLSMDLDLFRFYEALDVYASTYFFLDKFDTAYIHCKGVLDFCSNQPETLRIIKLRASANTLAGNHFKQLNMPDSAVAHYRQAYQDFKTLKQTEQLPGILTNLGSIYSLKGDFAISVNCYRKALYLSDSLNLTRTLGFPIYFGLGQVYSDLRDFDLSDSYYRLAEKFYDERGWREKIRFCNNRGAYHFYKKEYFQALDWNLMAKALANDVKSDYYKSISEINLAEIYLNMNALDSVRTCLDRSLRYFSTVSNSTARYFITTIEIGLALKENKFSKIPALLKQSSQPPGIDLNMVSTRNMYLEQYYVKLGDYRQAYIYQSKNRTMSDSILVDRKLKKSAELDMRYKLDTTDLRKDLLIQNQKAQLTDLRLTTYIWALVCLLLVTIVLFLYLFMRRQRDLQRLRFIDQVTRLRMQNIRNQISPHFVLNVLNREIISVEENKRNGLYGLAKLLRESLEMTEKPYVTLEKELEFVQTFIQLERGSLEPDFQLFWEIDKRVDTRNVNIPPMIIQIPVENAIKHGLRPKTGKKILSLRVIQEDNGVTITIQDNGLGYYPGEISNSRGTGTGMNVLHQTVLLLNSKNSEKIDFKIHNTQEDKLGGAEAVIYLPGNIKFE